MPARLDDAGGMPRPVGRWVVACAITGTVLIGLGAFWLSFTALADLARQAGTPAELAWVWPLIVDGVIVVATVSVVALSGHGPAATRYPWLLLAGGAAVSVSANITHALVAAEATVPPLLAALVASVPPVVLLAITHLTVELTRHHRPSRAATNNNTTTQLEPSSGTAGQEGENRHSQNPPPPAEGNIGIGKVNHPVRHAQRLREAGMSNRKIAQQLGVHPSTVGRWLAPHPAAQQSAVRELSEGDHHGISDDSP